ncbi:hypothetical protein AAEX28_04140 [Lentisphaerota bacterium WC36G]|nr:DUF5309 domain-containing protein [Lentisphaerae bacterium WC36]
MFNLGKANEFSDEKTIHDPAILAAAKAAENPPFTGVFYQAMKAPMETLDTKDFKVFSRNGLTRDGVIGTAWTKTATTGLAIKAECLNGLTVGHVLKVGSEVVCIKSVDRAANTISVFQRGHGTGVASAHDTGAAFETIGFAGSDEMLHNVDSCSGVTDEYINYVQTIFEVVDWTKGAELKRKGLTDGQINAVLLKEGQERVNANLARMAIHGVRQKGDTNTPFMSAGLIEQLTDTCDGKRNVIVCDDAGAAFSKKTLDANIQKVIDAGGAVDTVLVSPVMRNWFNSLDDVLVTKSKDDHVAGSYNTQYNYNGMIINIMVDRDIPKTCYGLLSIGKCYKQWLKDDGLKKVKEPALNSRLRRESIQGSVAFLIEGVGKWHAWVKNVGEGTAEKVFKVDNVGNVSS